MGRQGPYILPDIFSPTTLYQPDSWEIRGGGFARCCFAENGFDAGLEIVAPRLFATHNAIGCTTVIHSGGNIGYRVDRHWSVMLSLEHVSNAGLCNRNVGINSYGAKVGYAF